MDPHYLQLISEAALNRTLYAFASDIRFFAMLYFGGYSMLVTALVAALGATIGATMNYGFGWVLGQCQYNGISTVPWEKYDLWAKRLALFMPLIGLLSWIHLMGAAVTAVGFLRVSPLKVIPFLFFGQMVYYGYYVF